MKYPKEDDFSGIIQYALSAKRVEPIERMHGGPFPVQHAHRFEIKGGVTIMSLMAKNISSNNALLKRLKERGN